jgi:hypothetical protein
MGEPSPLVEDCQPRDEEEEDVIQTPLEEEEDEGDEGMIWDGDGGFSDPAWSSHPFPSHDGSLSRCAPTVQEQERR